MNAAVCHDCQETVCLKLNQGKVQEWTLDLKKNGDVVAGVGAAKPDIVIAVADVNS